MTTKLPSSSETTLPMTVANTGFMLDRLGQDCAPLQFLRELTKNAIEAILATNEKTGDVVWDVDWATYDLTGQYKLCVTDTGIGMSGAELMNYINQLSSSVHQHSHDGNFGVGAKISAATKNHAGLVYLSWKDGIGSMIHLWRDPDTHTYGLKQLETPDGQFHHWAVIENDVKPNAIGQHGTKVVLLGNDNQENTMLPPDGSRTTTKWIRRYLNTRFFRFPEGINVKVYEGWDKPDRSGSGLWRITGQQHYLNGHSESSGQVQLENATAHWWILKDDEGIRDNIGQIASTGHIAALYKDELYELLEAPRGGIQRLQQFGVIFGHRRVVIYVEPEDDGTNRLSSNTARTHLLIDHEALPWAEWAANFRSRMPAEIVALIEASVSGSSSNSHQDAIRERLKRIKDLLKLTRYRPTPKGTLSVDENAPTPGGVPGEIAEAIGRENNRKGGVGGKAGSIYALFLKADGIPGEEVGGDMTPEVNWISVGDGTRVPGQLEDRAASYLEDTNRLLINADFRVFVDMVEKYQKLYEDVPGVNAVVEDVVREWFEQNIIETVLGVHSLKGSQLWSIEGLRSAWSDEALSACVMPRYHVDVAIKRSLAGKIGGAKE